MRGSPLLRTLVVLAGLLLAGLVLARLTAPAPPAAVAPSQAGIPDAPRKASFELLLSAAAKSVTLEGGGAAVLRENIAEPLAGSLEVIGEHPIVSLRVVWAENSPGHRFAKVRLDLPGRDSMEHVFVAPGDIDDIWEPMP